MSIDKHSVNFIDIMEDSNYPVPHSHKTFDFGPVTIDSNFDSGNIYNAEKVNNTNVSPSTCSTTSGLQSITSRINTVPGFISQSRASPKAAFSPSTSKICKIRYLSPYPVSTTKRRSSPRLSRIAQPGVEEDRSQGRYF